MTECSRFLKKHAIAYFDFKKADYKTTDGNHMTQSEGEQVFKRTCGFHCKKSEYQPCIFSNLKEPFLTAKSRRLREFWALAKAFVFQALAHDKNYMPFCEKIQAIYFKIYGLYFEICALCFFDILKALFFYKKGGEKITCFFARHAFILYSFPLQQYPS